MSKPEYAFDDTPEFWLELARRMVLNARPSKRGKCPRWVAVQDATGHGSTYSIHLCRYFNFDPNEMVKR